MAMSAAGKEKTDQGQKKFPLTYVAPGGADGDRMIFIKYSYLLQTSWIFNRYNPTTLAACLIH
jgi:hypothetical protein